MCIAVFSTAHPDYALILINNRDEFLARPTKRADWWELPHSNVLGGRDLLRHEQGTWLGVTREGRLAVLTNFREDGDANAEARSRGDLVKSYLTQPALSGMSTQEFLSRLIESDGLKDVGGFSLVCGVIGKPLAVISNRTPDTNSIHWILGAKGETVGLSNAVITDRSWTKVTEAEKLLQECIENSIRSQTSQADLVDQLFRILSVDTLPKPEDSTDWAIQVNEMRKSIFIPAVGERSQAKAPAPAISTANPHERLQTKPALSPSGAGFDGLYGTQRQTIILVEHSGKVRFVERSVNHGDRPKAGESLPDAVFEFLIGAP